MPTWFESRRGICKGYYECSQSIPNWGEGRDRQSLNIHEIFLQKWSCIIAMSCFCEVLLFAFQYVTAEVRFLFTTCRNVSIMYCMDCENARHISFFGKIQTEWAECCSSSRKSWKVKGQPWMPPSHFVETEKKIARKVFWYGFPDVRDFAQLLANLCSGSQTLRSSDFRAPGNSIAHISRTGWGFVFDVLYSVVQLHRDGVTRVKGATIARTLIVKGSQAPILHGLKRSQWHAFSKMASDASRGEFNQCTTANWGDMVRDCVSELFQKQIPRFTRYSGGNKAILSSTAQAWVS